LLVSETRRDTSGTRHCRLDITLLERLIW
jgi:hypothetical protein